MEWVVSAIAHDFYAPLSLAAAYLLITAHIGHEAEVPVPLWDGAFARQRSPYSPSLIDCEISSFSAVRRDKEIT